MKALVIGAAGFVGNYLIDSIKADLGCDVCITKLPMHVCNRQDVEVFDLNVLDEAMMYQCLMQVKPDYIFYLAAQSSISVSWKKPTETVEVNVKGSLNLLNAIRKLGSNPRVLLVGSGEEYGIIPPECVPIQEDALINPQNIYAATKVCQNMMGSIYHSAYGLQLIMVRAFNHMGAGQADTFVVSDFCHQVARIEYGLQEPIIRVGNLAAKRDFTDVRDVTHAYTSLIQFGNAGETYNVGSGKAIMIRDILDEIIKRSTCDIEVYVDPQKLRPIDVPIIEADISKIYSVCGWHPRIPLADTVDAMLEYWRGKCKEEADLCGHS